MISSLWVLCVGGLLLGLASPCPPPCSCPLLELTCDGCPKDYLTVGSDTLSLSVSGCKDILYLLRLHHSLPPDKRGSKFSLQKLQITDSSIEKIPVTYVSDDYAIQSLVMRNNSIQTLDVGLEAMNLTYFDLSRNHLVYVKSKTFERMSHIVTLNLGYNRIENMSVHAFVGLKELVHLDLSFNNLTYLMDEIFLPLVSLQDLNLSFNKLEALSEKCFGSLLLLQQLDISYNRLTSVAPGTLQFLPNLAKLLLADNPQLKPDAQIFVGTGQRLQKVDASRTGLKRVPEALTHSVRFLSLQGNRISTLRCGDMDGYPLLYMLDFGDNIIENVEDDALGRLEMLFILYLNNNRLQTVPRMLPDTLHYLSLENNVIESLSASDFATLGSHLRSLLLANNLISYIKENVFAQLTNLEELDVSNNPLKTLTPNTFAGPTALKDFRIALVKISPPARDISFPIPSPEGLERLHLQHSPGLTKEFLADTAALAAMSRLEYLDISYANVKSIRSDLLHFLPQLKILRLDGNAIDCTDMNWLAEWMRNNLNNEYTKVKCSYPPEWLGKYIIELPSANKTNYKSATTMNPIDPSLTTSIVSPMKNSTDSNDKHAINNIQDFNNTKNGSEYLPSDKKETILMKRQNISQIEILKNNSWYRNDYLKNLLDLANKEKYNSIIKIQKDRQNTSMTSVDKNENVDINVKNTSNNNMTNKTDAKITSDVADSRNKEYKQKKIYKFIPANNTKTNISDKLIEIFKQLSHKDENYVNTSKQQKTNSKKQESVLLCTETGNLNGTENKTKCSQHPEIAPVPSEKSENKNIEPGRFIYRKNVNESSINAKPEKTKYVSKPSERYNTSKILGEKDTPGNDTSSKLHQFAYQIRGIESPDALVQEHGSLYRHNLHSSMLADTASHDSTTSAWKADTKNVAKQSSLASNVTEFKRYVKHTKNVTNVNKALKEPYEKEKITFEPKVEERENSSEFQMSRFRAEASGSQGGLGLGALMGVCGAACAALAGACLARRRPQPHARHNSPEMIEVHTITAVGELW